MNAMLTYHQQLRRPNWAMALECFLSRYINYRYFGGDDNTELDLIRSAVAHPPKAQNF